MKIETELNRLLGISHPLLMAPMFLVSNSEMMKAALRNGIAGAFPSLNFRNKGELENILDDLNSYKKQIQTGGGTYGVNLIVQKTNPHYEKHLSLCVERRVPFYITSLGNPEKVIRAAHSYGAKVFCDVTNLDHAQKSFNLGCDGFIAVGQGAGGHAGPFPLSILVPSLRERFPGIPVIAAGGIATGAGVLSMLALGAAGVSIGTRFIASAEARVNDEYKQAVIQSGMKDIVMTERLSGTPCTIINTPYARQIGYRQNWFEKFLSNNPRTKKYFKMMVQVRGFRKLEQAVQPGNYKNLWCAGQSVQLIHEIRTCDEIITVLLDELNSSFEQLENLKKQ